MCTSEDTWEEAICKSFYMMNYRNEQKCRSDGPSGGLLFNPLLNTGLNLNLALIAQGLVYLSAENFQG